MPRQATTYGKSGIREAYTTGRRTITLRAKAVWE
jgi:DNA gyrase/topoisomerase IV subunit A